MRRGARLLLLAFILALSVGPGSLAADDKLDAETQELLDLVRKDKGPGTWLAAVRTLKAGDANQRSALAQALLRLFDQRLPRLKREVDGLDALAAQVGDGRSARKLVAAWDAQRRRAVRWIFDPVSFPAPEGGRVTGPMRGSREARQRCDAAVAIYAPLRRRLDRAVGSALDLRDAKADALLADYAVAYMEVAGVVQEMAGLAKPPKPLPEPSPTAMLLLDARLGRFAALARTYERIPDGWLKLCIFHAYGRGILRFNAEHPCGMSDEAVEAIVAINDVRMALGVSPAAHSRRLVRTAQTHTDEMIKLEYWGHRSPVPEHRTSTLRAALQGYRGEVTECLALADGPAQSLPIWYWDGGHFRGLVHPHWNECGLSHRKPVTWNAGADDSGRRPGIRYRWPAHLDTNR